MSVGAVVDVRRWDDVAGSRPRGDLPRARRALPGDRRAAAQRHAGVADPDHPRLLVRLERASAGRGWLLAGDAACFIDPVFSTGVHLACLAGLPRRARGARRAARRRAEERGAGGVRAELSRRLRALPALPLLLLRPQHRPRLVLLDGAPACSRTSPADLDARTAFVRLMSGGGDWDALPGRRSSASTSRWARPSAAAAPARCRATTSCACAPRSG